MTLVRATQEGRYERTNVSIGDIFEWDEEKHRLGKWVQVIAMKSPEPESRNEVPPDVPVKPPAGLPHKKKAIVKKTKRPIAKKQVKR